MLSSRSCIKSALPPLTPLSLSHPVDPPPVHSPRQSVSLTSLLDINVSSSISLFLSPPSHSLSFLLLPAYRPDRVALLPPPNRIAASTNPLPCRPMSPRPPPFTSLSHELASLTFPPPVFSPLPTSPYSTSLPLSHTYNNGASVPRFYSDGTVAPPARDASKRFHPPASSRLTAVHVPSTTPDAAVLRYILARRPCRSIDSPSLPPFSSYPTFSRPTRHVPPLTLFSSLRLTGSQLACLLAWPA